MFDKLVEISKALMQEGFTTKTFHTTFILRKHKIQKIGINVDKTHPANLKFNYRGLNNVDTRTMIGIHSEMSAVLKYGKEDCSDCTFVNIRIDKNNNVTMSKPCVGCQCLLRQVGFKRLYYTNNKGNFENWI